MERTVETPSGSVSVAVDGSGSARVLSNAEAVMEVIDGVAAWIENLTDRPR